MLQLPLFMVPVLHVLPHSLLLGHTDLQELLL